MLESCLQALCSKFPQWPGEVHALIEGLNSTRGHVICGIFQSADGFPKEAQRAVKVVSVPANPTGALCAFPDLPAGTYAVSIFHDENDDGVLKTNLIGMPLEGYGVSNNHTHAVRAPNFEESQFTVDAQATTELRIRMKY